jgi:hypothetical protein
MKNINQRRKYSNFKYFNDCCATALHEATDKWVESLGCTLKAGGEKDFIISNYYQKVAKKNRNILRKVTRCQQQKPSERLTGTANSD